MKAGDRVRIKRRFGYREGYIAGTVIGPAAVASIVFVQVDGVAHSPSAFLRRNVELIKKKPNPISYWK
jgi:hypothetical protein